MPRLWLLLWSNGCSRTLYPLADRSCPACSIQWCILAFGTHFTRQNVLQSVHRVTILISHWPLGDRSVPASRSAHSARTSGSNQGNSNRVCHCSGNGPALVPSAISDFTLRFGLSVTALTPSRSSSSGCSSLDLSQRKVTTLASPTPAVSDSSSLAYPL